MPLPISVTYTFATANSPIPLSQLDANFATVVNGVNGIGNGTNSLSNVVITGGTIDGANIGGSTSSTGRFSTVTATTGNIVTVNATTLNAATHRSDGNLTLQSNGSSTALTVNTIQYVGIGTTSPVEKLDVSGATSTYARIRSINAGTGAGLYFTNNTASYLIGAGPTSGLSEFAIVDYTGSPVERMRVAANGNVGIGTSNPTVLLDVYGSIKARASTGETLTIGGASNTTYLSPSSGSVNILTSGGSSYRATFDDNLIQFYNANTVVASIGALASGTSSWSPNGTNTRVAISDTSMQLHYDCIVLGKDLLGTVGGRGPGVTWKTPTVTTDAVYGNIGGRIAGNQAWVFETGGQGNNGNPFEFYTQDASNNQTLRMSINGGVATSNFFIANSSVGINTASPAYRLDVNGNAIVGDGTDRTPTTGYSGQLNVQGNGYVGGFSLNASGMFVGHNSASRALIFAVDNSEKGRVDTLGNLLWGATSTSWNGSLSTSASTITLASGASINLSSGICGSAIVAVYVTASGNGGLFYLNYKATSVKIAGDGEATDTGSDFAVYKSALSHVSVLKNKSASSQTFSVNILAGQLS